MVLSTVDKSSAVPWSAPVYFLYSHRSFYFFSSPKSRHATQFTDTEVAVSIFSQTKEWSNIQGIQMLGNVTRVESKQLTKKLSKKYFSKFELFNDLFPFLKIKHTTLSHLLKKVGSSLYSFKPCKVTYSDNYFGFGFKKNFIIRKKNLEPRT